MDSETCIDNIDVQALVEDGVIKISVLMEKLVQSVQQVHQS